MIKIIHRVNTIEKLVTVPSQYGVEIDIRAYNSSLVLNHEPYQDGELLETFLQKYKHALVIFNIKEAGIESDVIALAAKYQVKEYFLLDVEFPYIYKAAREGQKNIAMRFSEDESIETVLKYKGKADWVWIDTISKLPLDKKAVKLLNGFKTCLVCPERWGRPEDIPKYREQLKALQFQPDAVMTSLNCLQAWEKQN
jgi:hypothetical protein